MCPLQYTPLLFIHTLSLHTGTYSHVQNERAEFEIQSDVQKVTEGHLHVVVWSVCLGVCVSGCVCVRVCLGVCV